jgi:transcriptional regulator with XRE-family HTH domain
MADHSKLSFAAGQRLHELRIAAGLTPQRLAKRAGVRPSDLLDMEEGRKRPSIETLDKLAKQLGVSVIDLVRGAPSVAPPPRPSAVQSAPVSPGRVGGGLRDLEQIANAIVALPDRVGDKLEAVDAAVVSRALDVCQGNKSAAARLLGIERKAVFRQLEKIERRAKKNRRKRSG